MKPKTYSKASGLSGLRKTYEPDARVWGVGFVGFPFREPDTRRHPTPTTKTRWF